MWLGIYEVEHLNTPTQPSGTIWGMKDKIVEQK